jgi:hypothetical protein
MTPRGSQASATLRFPREVPQEHWAKCIVLYCIVLYCIVLYCIVLYCIVLYCIVLYCIVLYCIVLYCIVLYCIVLYCIVLHCIVLYCIVLYCIVLYCILTVHAPRDPLMTHPPLLPADLSVRCWCCCADPAQRAPMLCMLPLLLLTHVQPVAAAWLAEKHEVQLSPCKQQQQQQQQQQ